jgi:NodT family efflux transporter outer membrane factor (OMF) lipoprotein
MWKVAAAAGFSLLLVGCAVGPKYQRPTAPAPPAYKEGPGGEQWKTATPSEGTLRANWWEVFDDPQLNQLEEMVPAANQSLKQAEAQFRQARALVRLNQANYYPTVTGQVSVTNSRTPVSSSGINRGPVTNFSLPVGASWEPDFWGRVRLTVESATANAQTTAADLANLRLSIQGELAADYFQLLGLDMEQSLLSDTLAAYERAVKLTIDRFNGGVASKVDVAQAQTQLASTRAELTDFGVVRSQLEHAIAVLTGQPPAGFSIAPGKIQGPPPPIPAGVPSELLERRPDIAASERLVGAANAQIGLAETAYYPTLTLSATGGVESSRITTWLSWPSRFWSLGPTLAQTLLDFGRRKAQVQGAEAAYDATVAGYRQTVLGAFQEVEDNLSTLRILAREALQQDEAVKGAQESLRLELDRYKSGTVSYLDVITTQTIALTNESTAVGLLSRRMTAAVQLIRALGGGWNATTLPSPAELRQAEAAKPGPAQQPGVQP